MIMIFVGGLVIGNYLNRVNELKVLSKCCFLPSESCVETVTAAVNLRTATPA